ncbi:MAG: winged helix DNA-binding protein [Lachnospiraceae bacterium]|nr:winged helix DNA-binding protein [Lachnospiraceae bacterium]
MSDNLHGEPMIMNFIMHQETPVTPGAISRGTGMTSARVAAALGNLEKKGLIRRTVDEKDKRRFLISLTEKGRDFAADRKRELFTTIQRMLEFLGEEDSAELIRILKRLKTWIPDCGNE